MELKEQLEHALKELRALPEAQRKFSQSIDLIINLQKVDVRKSTVNTFIQIPHQAKEKKVAAFLEIKNKDVETITPDEFAKYTDKKSLKRLVSKYDFFIAQASIMPKVATAFGRFLGPAGKMPSPQLGILMNPDEKEIQKIKEKINASLRIKLKEPSIKVAVGKQSMKDEEIIENVIAVFNSVIKLFPRERENVKNIEIKFTMTKPLKIRIR